MGDFMKTILLSALIATAASNGLAQELLVAQNQAGETEVLVPQQTVVKPVAPVVPNQVTTSPGQIYILNSQNQRAAAANANIQEQPNTLIEASPLKESRAEQLRRSRQGMETQTEQKIVEKLEEARMEDERARADRLFGSGFGSGRNEQPVQQMQPVQPMQPAPVQVVPAPVVVAEPAVAAPIKEEEPKVNIREEVRAALEDANRKEEKTNFYVAAQAGVAEYPDVKNIRGNMSTGFSVGMVTPERVAIEAGFLYSTYTLEVVDPYAYGYTPYPLFKDLTQYNYTAAVKYLVLPGRFRPFMGALVSYTNRKYSDKTSYLPYSANNDVSTNAFDIGVTAGMDLQFTSTFAVGFDFRYLTNISYNEEYPRSIYAPRRGTPVEKLDYYTAGLVAKFTF